MKIIYEEISKLTPKFRTMAYGLTTDKNTVDEAVQELMLYLLQMNKSTLSAIFEKDGIDGVTRYGAVALRRALTSPRSNFYYKYTKYYTHIQDYSDIKLDQVVGGCRDIENIPNATNCTYQWTSLEKIDVALNDFTWYDKKVFELYYHENNTLDSLAKKTGISRNSLFTTIDKVRVQLKQKLKE